MACQAGSVKPRGLRTGGLPKSNKNVFSKIGFPNSYNFFRNQCIHTMHTIHTIYPIYHAEPYASVVPSRLCFKRSRLTR